MNRSIIDGMYIPDQYEKHMSTTEVMKHLGVCRATLHDWKKYGLPFHQVRPHGRCYYLLREVDAWLFSNQPPIHAKTCGDTSPAPQVHLLNARRAK